VIFARRVYQFSENAFPLLPQLFIAGRDGKCPQPLLQSVNSNTHLCSASKILFYLAHELNLCVGFNCRLLAVKSPRVPRTASK
jgi:hypothetical protein